MTQDKVSDELWNAFMLAWENAPDGEVVLQARFALNAVVSRLRAEGIRMAMKRLRHMSCTCSFKIEAVAAALDLASGLNDTKSLDPSGE